MRGYKAKCDLREGRWAKGDPAQGGDGGDSENCPKPQMIKSGGRGTIWGDWTSKITGRTGPWACSQLRAIMKTV